MEEALYDTPTFREFSGLNIGEDHLPNGSTILRFRHLLEAHNLSVQILTTVNAPLTAKGLLLKQGTVADATLIAAPSFIKNSSGKRDPEMHQTRLNEQRYHSMNAHIGADADTGLLHSVATAAANANDITQALALLHGEETRAYTDSGYRESKSAKRSRLNTPTSLGMWPSPRASAKRWKDTPMGAVLEKLEQTKASIRAKEEHPL